MLPTEKMHKRNEHRDVCITKLSKLRFGYKLPNKNPFLYRILPALAHNKAMRCHLMAFIFAFILNLFTLYLY
jgi:hypothetical protein